MSRFAPFVMLVAGLLGSSAQAATRAFPVGAFDRISSSGPFTVHVRTGPAPSVRAEAPQDVLDRMRIETHGGELSIGTTPGSWFSGWHMGRQKVVVEVTVPMLAAAALSGPGDLAIDRVRVRRFAASVSGPGDLSVGTIEAGDVDLRLSGPGNLNVAGHAATARIVLSGPGDIRARGLAVRDATVTLSGPGNIALTASGIVQGALSGPGDITVVGGARCAISKSGPGDVHCR